MTIRELAERTGMTVRNIRAHQTRGLLPPPVVRGRTGYYNEEHVARIELTREMQADGLNLEAIRRVLESGDGSATAISRLHPALRVPFEDETPEIIEADELAEIWGAEGRNQERLRAGRKARASLRTLPDGRIEVISPRMQQAAAELAELGIGAEAALAVGGEAETPRRRRRPRLRRPLRQEIWEPFEQAGRPEQDWPRIARGARTAAAARLAERARDVPDRDGRGGREGERADPEARSPRDQTGETGERKPKRGS